MDKGSLLNILTVGLSGDWNVIVSFDTVLSVYLQV